MTMIISGSGGATFPDSTTQTTAASTATPFAITGNSTAGAEIRLPEDTDNGSNYVALKAANSLASNLTFTLPSADGTSGQVLQTNGSGTLSFVTPSSTFVLLTSGTVSGNPTAIDVETGFTDAGYELILIYYENIACSSSGNPSFRFKIGGSYNSSASYNSRSMEVAASSVSANSAAAATSMVFGAVPQITSAGTSFAVVVQNRFQGGTTGAAFITNPWWGHQNNGTAAGTSYGFISASGDVQGLRFLMTGGGGATQFTGGTYYAYGIKTT